MPHDRILHAIELLGTKVAPEVRKYTAQKGRTSNKTTVE
jgi:hypothetical protein